MPLARFGNVTGSIKRYLAIKTMTSLLTGAVIGISLAFLGVENAVLWGLLAFMLNYVPNIGSIIAAVPAVLFALVQLGVGGALATAAVFAVVNVIIGSVLEPRFMGRGLGLSTLVVFVSLVFWGWVLGPVGMFLSVPLTMTVKIALGARRGHALDRGISRLGPGWLAPAECREAAEPASGWDRIRPQRIRGGLT